MPFALRQRFRDLPIRSKMLLGGVLPLFAILSIGGALTMLAQERAMAGHLDAELRNTTTLITEMVRASAETSIRNHLRSVAETQLALAKHFHDQALQGQYSQAEAKRRFSALLLAQRVGETGYLYVVDPAGVVRVHPSQALVGQSVARHAFVQRQIREREGYIEYDWQNPGEPTPRAKALYSTYFQPWEWIISASSYRSEFISLVNVDDFRSRILSLQLGHTGYPFVMDRSGRLLIHPVIEGRSLEDPANPLGRAFLEAVLRQRSGEVTYYWNDPGAAKARLKRCHFREIPELGWIVGSTFYVDDAYASLQAMRRNFLLVLATVLLVAVPIVLWFTTWITRPLSLLANAFSPRNPTMAPVPVASRDEVGRLAEGYNAFATALEHSQMGLRESEARFRGFFENTVEGLVQSTPEGRLLQVNPALARLFGYASPAAMLDDLGADATRLYARPSDRAQVITGVQQRLGHAFEVEFQRRDGTRFWGSLKAMAAQGPDPRTQVIDSMVEDITERRQRQEELEHLVQQRTRELREAKEVAEEATQAKSAFLSSMSHELRTPLNAILLYANLLAEEASERGATELHADLGRIQAAGQHLLGLVNNILDLAKIEAGHVQLVLETVEPHPVLKEVLLTLEPLARGRGNRLVLRCEDPLPAVKADVIRFRQILLNLGSNAAKFTENGCITLGCAAVDGQIRIEVADTGIGMTPEEAEKIGRPFVQTEEGRRAAQGTGLGLAISRSLAELMGGTLTLRTRKGEGTTFTLTLPQA